MARIRSAISLVLVASSLSGCYTAPSMDAAEAAYSVVSSESKSSPTADDFRRPPSARENLPVATDVVANRIVAADTVPAEHEPPRVEAHALTNEAGAVAEDRSTESDVAVGVPKVVLPDQTFDFGTMEPFQVRQHTFVIRNEGNAPLNVQEGQTSCKCTLGKLANGTVLPGDETTVTLQWRSGSGNKLFAHEAEILTNDPENPVVVVRVKGEIIASLFADPEAFTLPGIYPGKAANASVVVASQQWEGFDIRDVKTSMENLRWEIVPLTTEEAAGMSVKSGQRVTIILPDNLERGYFNHWLRMMIHPRAESPRLCEIPISGNVLRRVSIYGEGIDSTGLIKLGKVWQGRGLKKYFTIKVRDPDPQLEIESVTTDPTFLAVTFEPLTTVNKPGLYRMCVEIPTSAPRAVFMGELGSLRVDFKNPRCEDLNLRVQFAVMGDGDF